MWGFTTARLAPNGAKSKEVEPRQRTSQFSSSTQIPTSTPPSPYAHLLADLLSLQQYQLNLRLPYCDQLQIQRSPPYATVQSSPGLRCHLSLHPYLPSLPKWKTGRDLPLKMTLRRPRRDRLSMAIEAQLTQTCHGQKI